MRLQKILRAKCAPTFDSFLSVTAREQRPARPIRGLSYAGQIYSAPRPRWPEDVMQPETGIADQSCGLVQIPSSWPLIPTDRDHLFRSTAASRSRCRR
jgi:hypothetical protein